jgi:hypothetical protein
MPKYVYAKDRPEGWLTERAHEADFLIDQFRHLVSVKGIELHQAVEVYGYVDRTVPRLSVDSARGYDHGCKDFNRRQIAEAVAYAVKISEGCRAVDAREVLIADACRKLEQGGYPVQREEYAFQTHLPLNGRSLRATFVISKYDEDSGTHRLLPEALVEVDGLPPLATEHAVDLLNIVRDHAVKVW